MIKILPAVLIIDRPINATLSAACAYARLGIPSSSRCFTALSYSLPPYTLLHRLNPYADPTLCSVFGKYDHFVRDLDARGVEFPDPSHLGLSLIERNPYGWM